MDGMGNHIGNNKNEQCNDIYIDPASHDIDALGLNSEMFTVSEATPKWGPPRDNFILKAILVAPGLGVKSNTFN